MIERRGNPIYAAWVSMRHRCRNPSSRKWDHYGGRGIVVVEEWDEDYIPFYEWSIDNGWQPGLQIDRVDNDGPYSPDNCRWTTPVVNISNRRNTITFEYQGELYTARDLYDMLDPVVKFGTFRDRLIYGWSPEEAATRIRRNYPKERIE